MTMINGRRDRQQPVLRLATLLLVALVLVSACVSDEGSDPEDPSGSAQSNDAPTAPAEPVVDDDDRSPTKLPDPMWDELLLSPESAQTLADSLRGIEDRAFIEQSYLVLAVLQAGETPTDQELGALTALLETSDEERDAQEWIPELTAAVDAAAVLAIDDGVLAASESYTAFDPNAFQLLDDGLTDQVYAAVPELERIDASQGFDELFLSDGNGS